MLAINSASAAFMLSGIPFDGPIGAVRIAYSQDGEWIAHPTYAEGADATFELVVAGRQLDNGDVAIMMVEAGGTEKSFQYYADGAPKVDEAVLASGLDASKEFIKLSIELQNAARRQGGGRPRPDHAARLQAGVRLRPGRLRRGREAGHPQAVRGGEDRRQGRAQRRHRCRRSRSA